MAGDKPIPDAIGAADLLGRSVGTNDHDGLARATTDLLNLLVGVLGPVRSSAPGQFDGPLVTALVVYAGAIHGELVTLGAAPEMTTEAVTVLLSTNFNTGVALGRKRMLEAAVKHGTPMISSNDCPGHVAVDGNHKLCRYCGTSPEAEQ